MQVRDRTVLEPGGWATAQAEHSARADALTAAHRARRAAGIRHPIEDFLVDYYRLRPGRLRRWHPGVGAALAGADAPHAGERWYLTTTVHDQPVVTLDVPSFLADRGATVDHVRGLLEATASRPAQTGCLGLHEWAMVYRQDDPLRRHDLPLRLGRAGTDAVVEAHTIRCSHIDAFRFFTPQARPLNRLQPTRETQTELEQPGCLHATMDLLKWSMSLGPAVPGSLLLDCLELGFAARRLDMQASPYDVSSLGEPAVAIETAEGRAEYVARQQSLAEQAAPLRQALVEVCDRLLDSSPAP